MQFSFHCAGAIFGPDSERFVTDWVPLESTGCKIWTVHIDRMTFTAKKLSAKDGQKPARFPTFWYSESLNEYIYKWMNESYEIKFLSFNRHVRRLQVIEQTATSVERTSRRHLVNGTYNWNTNIKVHSHWTRGFALYRTAPQRNAIQRNATHRIRRERTITFTSQSSVA